MNDYGLVHKCWWERNGSYMNDYGEYMNDYGLVNECWWKRNGWYELRWWVYEWLWLSTWMLMEKKLLVWIAMLSMNYYDECMNHYDEYTNGSDLVYELWWTNYG